MDHQYILHILPEVVAAGTLPHHIPDIPRGEAAADSLFQLVEAAGIRHIAA